MKKFFISIVLLLSVLIGTTYMYYGHWRSEQQATDTLSYIPKNAALVYEISRFGEQWEDFQQTDIAKICHSIPDFTTVQQHIHLMESLVGGSQNLYEVPCTVSVHGLDEDHIGHIFYFHTHHKATRGSWRTIEANIQQDPACNTTVRKYAGYKLIKLKKRGITQPLFYIKKGPYIIASCSSLLIEDVVRGLADKQSANFINFKRTNNAQGSIYVNFSQLPKLLRTFVKRSQTSTPETAVATLALAGHLNLTLTSRHILLSGLTRSATDYPSCLKRVFTSQEAGALLLAPYLPQNTAILQHITFSDAAQLLSTLRQGQSSSLKDNLSETQHIDPLADILYPLLQGEVSHCVLAPQSGLPKDQLIFIKVKDTQALIEALERANVLNSVLFQMSSFKAYELTKQPLYDELLSQFFPYFKSSCITYIDDYVILSNNLAGLRAWCNQYLQGKTWIQDTQKTTWLNNRLAHAHYSLFVDLPEIQTLLMQTLKPNWQQVLETGNGTLQQFQHASLQFLHEQEDNYYVNILFEHQAPDTRKEHMKQQATHNVPDTPLDALPASDIFQTDSPVINRPWLVKSHRNNGWYTLLQDALYQLYFLDSDGKLLWKKSLNGPVNTDFIEVDYYNNGKIQYLFATDKQIHLIDYHGHGVGKYPYALNPTYQPIYLNVVDYNHSKNYRFLVATVQGNIYLKDKYYRPLPAWNPRILGKSFTCPPAHLRVQGRDYFLILQTDGTVQVLNRKGQHYPGSPIHLNASTQNPLLTRKGETDDTTALITLTDKGQLISINMAGHIQEVIQLDNPDDTSLFTLCPNYVTGHEYVIMQRSSDKISVLNEARELIFELPQIPQIRLQYYDFGERHQYYVVTDLASQLTSVYGNNGKPLHNVPLQNGNEVSMLFSSSQNQLQIYVGFEKSLVKYTLQVPSD